MVAAGGSYMDNIMDYLDWRGDVPLTVSALNPVDGYIFCTLAALNFEGIVPETGEGITVREAAEAYFTQGRGDYLGVLCTPWAGPLARRLGETPRFRDLVLSGRRERADREEARQFAALTVGLPDGSHFAVFRGTDDTIAGWKENFLMAVQEAIPAQMDAREYLIWAAEIYPGPLIVGGHSKGGNLAVYGAASAPPAVQARLAAVYNYDGPGFQEPFLQTPGYARVRGRIHTILPQNSMVGTLLTQETECTVVRSSHFGPAAHDGFTWEVRGTDFVRHEGGLSRSSRAFDAAMGTLLEERSEERRRQFIEEFFGVLTSTGAVTLTDLTEQKLRQALAMARNLHQEPEVRKFVTDMLERMVLDFVAEARKDLTVTAARRFRRRK